MIAVVLEPCHAKFMRGGTGCSKKFVAELVGTEIGILTMLRA